MKLTAVRQRSKTAAGEVLEHLREWPAGKLEITLLDRETSESRKRVFDRQCPNRGARAVIDN